MQIWNYYKNIMDKSLPEDEEIYAYWSTFNKNTLCMRWFLPTMHCSVRSTLVKAFYRLWVCPYVHNRIKESLESSGLGLRSWWISSRSAAHSLIVWPYISQIIRHTLCTVFELCWRSHSLLKVSPPEDGDLRLVINKMASFVAEGGAELEKKAKEEYRDDPVFSWVPRLELVVVCVGFGEQSKARIHETS